MRVYYMTSTDVARKYILPEQRMKVSRFKDLNDPFELSCHDIGHKNTRKGSKIFIETINKEYSLICFSETWKSPVMWAHYANKHSGVCLGFDINKKHLDYVNYIESRLLGFGKTSDQFGIEFINRMLYNKASAWEYEHELRAIVLLGEPQTDIYHIAFGVDMQLREVLIGARCELSPSDIAPEILPQEASVEIKKVRAAFKTFEMVENKRYKTITIPASPNCQSLHGVSRTGASFLLRPQQT